MIVHVAGPPETETELVVDTDSTAAGTAQHSAAAGDTVATTLGPVLREHERTILVQRCLRCDRLLMRAEPGNQPVERITTYALGTHVALSEDDQSAYKIENRELGEDEYPCYG